MQPLVQSPSVLLLSTLAVWKYTVLRARIEGEHDQCYLRLSKTHWPLRAGQTVANQTSSLTYGSQGSESPTLFFELFAYPCLKSFFFAFVCSIPIRILKLRSLEPANKFSYWYKMQVSNSGKVISSAMRERCVCSARSTIFCPHFYVHNNTSLVWFCDLFKVGHLSCFPPKPN